MKTQKWTRRIILVFIPLSLLLTPSAMAQFGQMEQPQTQFQSTSTMVSSGSVYSTTPMLNADGTAANPTSAAPVQAPGSRPRKIDVYTPTTDPNAPLGDAMLPLMLMAVGYIVVRVKRQKTTR